MAEVQGVESGNYNQQYGAQFNARDNAEQIKTQFLSLLVAQMKNQDPLNPVENQDFVAQLATFSSLEQLIEINGGITNLAKIGELQLLKGMTDIDEAGKESEAAEQPSGTE